jgi:hypothetical protein
MPEWFTQVGTFVTAITAAVGILAWPAKQLISTLLKGRLEKFKADLKHEHDEELASYKNDLATELEEFRGNLQHAHDKALAKYNLQLSEKSKSDERIRHEIISWANPIQEAAKSLWGRLDNLLNHKGYEALDPAYTNPDWSITHEYFTRSTAHLFGQYFCWIQMLRLELSFELFRTQADKVALFQKIDAVSKALADYDSKKTYQGTGNDTQIFRIQQQAMGELLATRRNGRRACRGYAFFQTKKADPEYVAAFAPAIRLIDKLQPGEKRFQRLQATLAALSDLVEHCDKLLALPGTTQP